MFHSAAVSHLNAFAHASLPGYYMPDFGGGPESDDEDEEDSEDDDAFGCGAARGVARACRNRRMS
jgi:hypothetical protein